MYKNYYMDRRYNDILVNYNDRLNNIRDDEKKISQW